MDRKVPLGPVLKRQVYLLSLVVHLVRLFGASCPEVVPFVDLSSFACQARNCLGNLLGLCREGACCMASRLVSHQGTCSFLFYRLVYLAEDHLDRSRVRHRSNKGHDRKVAWDRIPQVREDP